MCRYFNAKIKAVNYSAFESYICGNAKIHIEIQDHYFCIRLSRSGRRERLEGGYRFLWVELENMIAPDKHIERQIDRMLEDMVKADL